MIFRKKLYAGRAAVCAQNTQEQIKTAVVTAYTRFLELNRLREKDIISLQFSITSDITAAFLQCGTEYRRQSSWYNPFPFLLLWKKESCTGLFGRGGKTQAGSV